MQRRITPVLAEDLPRKMVLLAGPRQCGKTTVAQTLVEKRSGHYYSWDNEADRRSLHAHELDAATRLWAFDELHKYIRWRNWLKGVYDEYHRQYEILVTGSARLDFYSRGGDSLQGRYFLHRLHPLTYSELSGSVHNIKLDSLPLLEHSTPADLEDLLCLGGFPEPLLSGRARFASRWRLGYGARLVREEVRSVEQVKELDLIELLYDRLPATVGSPLSLNSLREDLEVSFDSVRRWIAVLENLYGCFRLPPFGAPRIKAVKKEQKLYLWDWSRVENPSARFENLLAFHLLRLTHWITDVEGEKAELRYLRDQLGREVDFVVLRKGKPWMFIEAKAAETEVSPQLRYFLERVPVPYAFQVTLQSDKDVVHPKINGCSVRITSAKRFLANLP